MLGEGGSMIDARIGSEQFQVHAVDPSKTRDDIEPLIPERVQPPELIEKKSVSLDTLKLFFAFPERYSITHEDRVTTSGMLHENKIVKLKKGDQAHSVDQIAGSYFIQLYDKQEESLYILERRNLSYDFVVDKKV